MYEFPDGPSDAVADKEDVVTLGAVHKAMDDFSRLLGEVDRVLGPTATEIQHDYCH